MTEITPDAILQIATSFMASKHLFVANEVGLFESLAEGPGTPDDLSQRTGVPRSTIRILADAMVALGLLERQAEHYQNGPLAATFLSGQTPADLRPVLRFWNHLSYPAWLHLDETVRTQKPAVGDLDEAQGKIFSEGIEALTAPFAEALATSYDFRSQHRVLDLGGGVGSFLFAILRHHPGLKTTLFEMPAVAALARQRILHTPLEESVEVVAGDFFQDPIPTGHDVVMLVNVLHLFSPEHNLTLLRRVRQHVPDGGRLLLVDVLTDPSHTQPLFSALMAGEFLLYTGEGASYSEEEVRGWLRESHWQPLEYMPLSGPASLIVAQTA
jgi:SAM-dependent methyltransferase